eukprot:CAMPEP_0202913146 /NCGR_PEP_ID=MMETSP1392-20130828/59705_1 /ASSEMBLY_ACC=CAM_ASM_000868 /TAXON_ID=225041 /ORGANISM="Chlamydomonas chlamydogama, Strain SAG 11-48b" /LENGTH=103 /DNA_ID=CAMNT_0049604307 /DNA_START=568 /DNA_END=879 /DNA_ORIENTATION=-
MSAWHRLAAPGSPYSPSSTVLLLLPSASQYCCYCCNSAGPPYIARHMTTGCTRHVSDHSGSTPDLEGCNSLGWGLTDLMGPAAPSCGVMMSDSAASTLRLRLR